MVSSTYVLLTAAKNEADFIERTLESVARQTVLPVRWVITSDGSTDRTDEIVKTYASRHAFIEFARRESADERDFRSKAIAVRHGYERVRHLPFDYIGNLDADVAFERTYFEQVLRRFELDPRLGIGGGRLLDLCNGRFSRLPCARNSVGGPVQLFRRACWEDVGGYLHVRYGVDAVAELTARMKGWRVESFADLEVRHYRETGTATRNSYGARFHDGRKAYGLGYHPLFFIARTVYRIRQRPLLLGALLAALGYAYAAVAGQDREVSQELVAYLRDEQLRRLRLRRTRSSA